MKEEYWELEKESDEKRKAATTTKKIEREGEEERERMKEREGMEEKERRILRVRKTERWKEKNNRKKLRERETERETERKRDEKSERESRRFVKSGHQQEQSKTRKDSLIIVSVIPDSTYFHGPSNRMKRMNNRKTYI